MRLLWMARGLVMLAGAAPLVGAEENGLPQVAVAALQAPGAGVIYALEPERKPGFLAESYYGYRVLGKGRLDAAQTKVAAEAMRGSVARWDGVMANCFHPRHALRVTAKDGAVFDFVLCLECHGLEVYREGKLLKKVGASGPSAVLDGVLREKGVQVPVRKVE